MDIRSESVQEIYRAKPSTMPWLDVPKVHDAFHEITDEYVAHAPLSLCIRELNRWLVLQSLIQEFNLKPDTVLDVGCGDGHWWKFGKTINARVFGIDINSAEVAQAKNVIQAKVSDISKEVPFAGIPFDLVIGNCSLEHVPNITSAIDNLHQAAAPGGALILFVPTPTWSYQGHIQGYLLRHFPRIAMSISGCINGFFQHWHLWDEQVWSALLNQHGWKVEKIQMLGNRRSEFAFRLFLIPAFFGFLVKKVSGFYPNRALVWLPRGARNIPRRILTWALASKSSSKESAYEYAIVAKRIS